MQTPAVKLYNKPWLLIIEEEALVDLRVYSGSYMCGEVDKDENEFTFMFE